MDSPDRVAGSLNPIKSWFCYMVQCSDESLYLGIASDVSERVKRHNWGVGPRYTASRRPVRLVWSEELKSSLAARRREKEIKGWSREKKLDLVRRWRGLGLEVGVNPSPASLAQDKGESSNG